MAKKVKVQAGHVEAMTAMLSEMMEHPISVDNLMSIEKWSEETSEVMLGYQREFNLEGKAAEVRARVDEEFSDINVLRSKSKLSRKEQELLRHRMEEKRERLQASLEEVLNEFRQMEVEVPACKYIVDDKQPAKYILNIIKSDLFVTK